MIFPSSFFPTSNLMFAPKARWSKMKRMVRLWHSGTGKAVVENLQVEKLGDLYAWNNGIMMSNGWFHDDFYWNSIHRLAPPRLSSIAQWPKAAQASCTWHSCYCYLKVGLRAQLTTPESSNHAAVQVVLDLEPFDALRPFSTEIEWVILLSQSHWYSKLPAKS